MCSWIGNVTDCITQLLMIWIQCFYMDRAVTWSYSSYNNLCRDKLLSTVVTPWDLPHTRTVQYVQTVQCLPCSQWKVTSPAFRTSSSADSSCGKTEKNFLEMQIRFSIKSEVQSNFSQTGQKWHILKLGLRSLLARSLSVTAWVLNWSTLADASEAFCDDTVLVGCDAVWFPLECLHRRWSRSPRKMKTIRNCERRYPLTKRNDVTSQDTWILSYTVESTTFDIPCSSPVHVK